MNPFKLAFVLVTLSLTLSITAQNNLCPSEMSLYLKLDEGSGTDASDETGTHTPTLYGSPTWVTGLSGQALELNGSDQYITVADHSDFDWPSDSSFSVELWARFTYVDGENKVMVGRDETGSNVHWWIGAESGTGYAAATIRDNAGTIVEFEGSQAINDDQWHHLVLVYDVSNQVAIIYVDGSQEVSVSYSPTGSFEGTSTIDIGYMSYNDVAGFFYTGQLDEVAVYGRALSQSEITEHYTAGLSGNGYCNVSSDVAPQITSVAPTTVETGSTYTYTVESEGSPAAEYSLTTYPTGMAINSSSGLIEWTPSEAGDYDVTVEAVNSAGTDTQSFTISVTDPSDCPSEMSLYLKLDEGSGTSAADETGTHTVTLHGSPTWSTGISEQALEFNGTDQYITVPDHTDFDWPSDSSFSVELWARFTYVDGENKVMAGRDETSTDVHWWIGAESGTGYPAATIRDNTGAIVDFTGSQAINDDQWHHLVLVCDVSGQAASIYVDGSQAGSASFTSPGSFEGVSTVDIGYMSYNDNARFFYTGLLDEVAIYGRALSQSEITEHYNAGLSGNGYCSVSSDVAPQITSVAPTTVETGSTYSYTVESEGSPAPEFSLVTYPTGMTIDASTGLVEWTPTAAGDYDVTIEATNSAGTDTQSFTITVTDPSDCPSEMSLYLKLDEGSGTDASDETGTHTVTLHGSPTWSTGISGQALEFNGTDQYITVPDHTDFDWPSDSSFSVELWARFTYVDGENKVMAGRDETSTDVHWWIGAESGTGYAAATIRDDAGTIVGFEGSQAINDGRWHHLALVCDVSSQAAIIYVDGSQEVSVSYSPTGSFEGTSTIDIGYMSSNDVAGFFYTGQLDEVAVYGRALSQSEISEHYTAGLSGNGYCNVSSDVAPQITSVAPTTVETGSTYTYTVESEGSPSPEYSLTTYPTGMAINSSSGLIEWTPSEAGDYDVTVEAVNSAGTDTQSFTISVTDPSDCPSEMSLYLKLDEGSGTSAADETGTHTPTLYGSPTWVTGLSGQALELNGSDQYITVADHSDFDWPTDSSFSVELWANFTYISGENKVLVGRDETSTDVHWWIGAESGTGYAAATIRDDAGTIVEFEGSQAINDGQWHHLALVCDVSSQAAIIYVDGSQEVSVSYSPTGSFEGTSTIDIGYMSYNDVARFFFTGQLDEVAVYGRALSQSEISEHYTAGLSGNGYCNIEPITLITPQNLSVEQNQTGEISLSWEYPISAPNGFLIERSIDDTLTFIQIDQVDGTILNYADNQIENERYYYYRIRAFNGTDTSEYTEIISILSLPQVPGCPGSFSASDIRDDRISLSWSDISENESGFIISRFLSSVLEKTDSIDENSITYTDTLLQPGTTYKYYICAYNMAGSSDCDSLTVTTLDENACNSDMITYFQFEDLVNGSTFDYVGDFIGQLYKDPQSTEGILGNALSFNSNSQYMKVEVDSALDWDADDDFTIELWTRFTNVDGQNKVMIGRDDGSKPHWWLGASNETGFASFYMLDQGGAGNGMEGYTAINDGNWHQLAVVHENSTNLVKLYVDTRLEASFSHDYSMGFAASTDLCIAHLEINGVLGYFFEGDLDEIAIFNEAMSQEEISEHYTRISGGEVYCEPSIHSPEILSEPSTLAVTDLPYDYQISCKAYPKANYRLITAPSGMSVDSITGLIEWLPLTDQIGEYSIVIEAYNSGGSEQQSFSLIVDTELPCSNSLITYISMTPTQEYEVEDIFELLNINRNGDLEFLTGQVSKAVSFDSDDEYITIESYKEFNWNNEGSFTIEFWMNPKEYTDYNQVIIGRDETNGTHWWVGLEANTNYPVFTLLDADQDGIAITGNEELSLDNWYHIVAVRDAAMGQNLLYVNNVLVGSEAFTYEQNFSSNSDIYLGALYLNSKIGYNYRGYLDEVSFYNDALTDVEIQYHYNKGLEGVRFCDLQSLPPEFVSMPINIAIDGSEYLYEVQTKSYPKATYSLADSPSGMTINSTSGLLSWLPSSSDIGTHNIEIQASNGLITSQSYELKVIQEPVCDTSIVSYYRFYEGTGSVVEDSYGNNNGSLVNSPSWTEGVENKALRFNGVDQSMNLDSSTDFSWSDTSSFTIELWTRFSTAGTRNSVIIGRDNNAQDLLTHWWVGTKMLTGEAAFALFDDTKTGMDIYGTTRLDDNEWHHIAAVRDGKLNRNILYVDGVIEKTYDIAYENGFDSDMPVSIGQLTINNKAGYFYGGDLDELAIHKRALSQEEISTHVSFGKLNMGYCPRPSKAPEFTSEPEEYAVVGMVNEYPIAFSGYPQPVLEIIQCPSGMQLQGDTLLIWEPQTTGDFSVSLGLVNEAGSADLTFTLHATEDMPCPDNTIALYYFDNVSSGILFDKYNQNNGFVKSSVSINTDGVVGNCYSFNGTDNYVTVPAGRDLQWGADENISIGFWLRYTEVNQSKNSVCIGADDGTLSHWWIGHNTDGQIVFTLNSQSYQSALETDEAYNDGYWHFVVAVRDAQKGKNLLYVDGVLKDELDITYLSDISTSDSLFIGQIRLNEENGYFFNGDLDEMFIDRSAWSSEYVNFFYNKGSDGDCNCVPDYFIPEIISEPLYSAIPGIEYKYRVKTNSRPQAQFSIIEGPTGLSIDSETGLVSWTPTTDQIGNSQVITIRATNSEGYDEQTYQVIPKESLNCQSGMVLYLEFYEGTGTTSNDAAASHNVDLNGTEWVDGIVDNAVKFNGSSSFFDIENHSDFNWDQETDFTIEVWVNTEDIPNGNAVIIGNDETNISHWWLGLESQTALPVFTLLEGDNLSGVTLYGDYKINDGKWHHLVVTRNATTDQVSMFVDGVLVSQQTYDYTTGFSTSTDVNVGYLTLKNKAGYHYLGILDELAIYTTCLVPETITQHYLFGQMNFGYCGNGKKAPIIINTPTSYTLLDIPFTDTVKAAGIPSPTFSLVSYPSNMVIDSETGVISWIAETGEFSTGNYNYTVQATNELGTDVFYGTITVVDEVECDPDLISYHDFNNAYGQKIVDNYGINDIEMNADLTKSVGSSDLAIHFDGDVIYGDMKNSHLFDWQKDGSFTIEYWAKFSNINGKNKVVIGRNQDNSTHWWLGFEHGTGLPVFNLLDNTQNGTALSGFYPLNDNTWHHIAIVRDGSENKILMYVDGRFQSSTYFEYGSGFSCDVPVGIGYMKMKGVDDYKYTGDLDELMVFNSAVSADDIYLHYQNGSAGKQNCNCQLEAPVIVSHPVKSARINREYSYKVNTLSKYPVKYTLSSSPQGMKIDSLSGIITWFPTESYTGNVTITVNSALGEATQSYTISTEKIRIMPMGNSITYDDRVSDANPALYRLPEDRPGYRYKLYQLLTDAGYEFDFVGSEVSGSNYFPDPENAGFPGIRSDQLAVLLETGYNERTEIQVTNMPYLTLYETDIVLLHIGTNDLGSNTMDADGVTLILDEIDNYEAMSGNPVTVILASIISREGETCTSHENTTIYNQILSGLYEERLEAGDDIFFTDMQCGAGIDYSTEMSDYLHPKPEGYEKMAVVWFNALEDLFEYNLYQPTDLEAITTASGTLKLSWKDNTNDESGYQLERKTGNQSEFDVLATLPANTTSYEDNTDPDIVYYYRVKAISSTSQSKYSNVINVSTLVNTPVLEQIEPLSDATMKITWQDLSDNETSFAVERSLDPDYGYEVINTLPANSTEYTDNYLSGSTTYYYRVKALTSDCSSESSNILYESTLSVPDAPGGVSAFALSESSVQISWQSNFTNELGFLIERKTSGDYESLTVIPASSMNYIDGGLEIGTTYTYRITAIYMNGRASDEVRVTTLQPYEVSEPTITMNYIRTYQPRVPINNISDINSRGDAVETIQYFDGLGRLVQTVNVKASPKGRDIVHPVYYDIFGRDSLKFLPYWGGTNGRYYKYATSFESGASGSCINNYKLMTTVGRDQDEMPYTVIEYENSPLNRILSETGPGKAWHDAGKSVSYNYGTNSTEVTSWKPTSNQEDNYAAAQLYVTEITDVDDHTAREYKDKQGKVVQKEVILNGESLLTRYVYDDFGLLRTVIPPEADSPSDSGYCYYYTYDEYRRMTGKKLPGAGWVYMVYDRRDRLVLTQDGKMRAEDNHMYLFTKYDTLNRPTVTGIIIINDDLEIIRSNFQNYTGTVNDYFSGKSSTYGYDLNTCYPEGYDVETENILTITYYDNYDFTNHPDVTDFDYTTYTPEGSGFASSESDKTKGLLTGGMVRMLKVENSDYTETDSILFNIVYYDDYGNAIRSISENHLGGRDIVFNDYAPITYQLIKTEQKHIKGSNSISIKEEYYYDAMGRLLETRHQVDDQPEVILNAYRYNELGESIAKFIHSDEGSGTFIQKTDYHYNIRGWLTAINDPDLGSDNDQFGMKLYYNSLSEFNGVSSDGCYNGNISAMEWNSATDIKRSYSYTYDDLNRLLTAKYADGSSLSENIGNYNTTIDLYDKNGNIKNLKRWYQGNLVDNLTYNYLDDNSNQLLKVSDNADYNGENDYRELSVGNYAYDENGNMISDPGKNTSVLYNYLNLPKRVSSNNDKVFYHYDAAGNKHTQLVMDGTSISSITHYVGNIVYQDDEIVYILTSEGRITPEQTEDGKNWRYEYHLKDHLGNTHAVVTNSETTGGVEVLQHSSYYPFGAAFEQQTFTSLENKNKYLYNGKELQDAMLDGVKLDWYDYGARMYDAAIGRWHCIDPKSEKYSSFSPYNYVLNNPLLLVDPNGEDVWIYYKDEDGKRQKILYTPGMKYEGNNEFVANSVNNLHKIYATDKGKEVLDLLTSPDQLVKVKEAGSKWGTNYNFNTNTLKYDDNAKDGSVGGGTYNALVGLTHELKHAHQDAQGWNPVSRKVESNMEKDAVNFTNYMRSVYGMEKMRTRYTSYGLSFSGNENAYNPSGEKVQGFQVQQNWLNGERPGVSYTGNPNADNTRIPLYYPGVKTGQNMIYKKTYNSTGTIINVNQPLK